MSNDNPLNNILLKDTNLYIFRHAETYQTKNNIKYGKDIVKADILPEGLPAIKKLAEFLKDIPTDANYTSPFKRCIQTVEIVTDISKKSFQVNDYLGEYLDGKESFEYFSKRVYEFIKHLNKQAIKSASICTHGGVIAGFISYLTKGSFELSDLYNFPKPGILVTIKNGEVTMKDFNNLEKKETEN